jgi:hypothetical protein
MARMKLRATKHVHAPPCRNVVPTVFHSDGQNAGYFLRTLWTVLLALGSSDPPLFIRTLRLLRGNSYLWCVRVVISERPTTDRIHRTRQVVEAPTLRWMFEAAREALAVLQHEVDAELSRRRRGSHGIACWRSQSYGMIHRSSEVDSCLGP